MAFAITITEFLRVDDIYAIAAQHVKDYLNSYWARPANGHLANILVVN